MAWNRQQTIDLGVKGFCALFNPFWNCFDVFAGENASLLVGDADTLDGAKRVASIHAESGLVK